MKKLTTFSILIPFLISITNGQLVRDLFYQKAGWSNVPERPQNCTFPCYDMSNKMLNFDIIVSLDEECPRLEANMEIKPFQKMSPCGNEEVKLSLICLPTYCTLQMFTGNYRVFAGKSECKDFKCIPAIPVILKSPHSDFHVKIVGILTLQGYYRDRDTPH